MQNRFRPYLAATILAPLFVAAAYAAGCSSGETGPAGPAGAQGATGAAGTPGTSGSAGSPGATGTAGTPGASGPQGPGGSNGEAGAPGATGPQGPGGDGGLSGRPDPAAAFPTATKIKHLVVIFGENVSFDHYFATYPKATNPKGEPPFVAVDGTPAPNNLSTPLDATKNFAPLTGVDLLNANPTAANGANDGGAANPFRLGHSEAATQDMGHNYKPEQQASNAGAMDLFPLYTGTAGPPPATDGGPAATTAAVMAYYDGNTVSALWSYAQNYAMNDNTWTTVFGPSTPGAINLISGQTNGFAKMNHTPFGVNHAVADGNGGWTMIGDTDPLGDVCSTGADQNLMAGKNVGDLLNTAKVSWGWFEGGFDLTLTNANGTTGCARSSTQTVANAPYNSADYIPHHQPFQYYASTANPNHWRPSSVTAVGSSVEDDGKTVEPANHQYDSHDFFDALHAGNFPAVSYLKAPAYQDGHPGYSNPVDEQVFIQQVVTAVQSSGFWDSTAIVITYDDSDGWYDHQGPPIVNSSSSVMDALNGAGSCVSGVQQSSAASAALKGNDGNVAQGRCGYGSRIPLLVISPFAKKNFVDHTLIDQSSVLRFVEDNGLSGQRLQPGGSFDTIAGSIQSMMNL
jgi:phospholipase C